MTTLEWSETDHGYTSGGYKITRSGAKRWSIDFDNSIKALVGRHRAPDAWTFGSLPSARAAALHVEVVRVRRIKLIRHVTLAIVAMGFSFAFYIVMSAGTIVNHLEWFTLASVAMVFALNEGIEGFALLVADGWDHRYEVPHVSMLDRTVSLAVIAIFWPRPQEATISEADLNVTPLT